MSDTGDISDVSEDPSDQRTEVDDPGEELAEDPVTGSTPTDPAVEDAGLPPAGDDPMGGEAPSS